MCGISQLDNLIGRGLSCRQELGSISLAGPQPLPHPHDIAALQARARDFSVERISAQYLDLLFPATGAEQDA